MRTPRTIDEIADQLLPADGDGLHERALCLLLAEHERSFHELENRCRLLESRSYAANERLDALERCEPGDGLIDSTGREQVDGNARTPNSGSAECHNATELNRRCALDSESGAAGSIAAPAPSALQPSPATPSADTADGIPPWRGIVAQAWNAPRNSLKVLDPDLAEDIAQLVYAEVSRREAGLREECDRRIAVYKAASSNANALRVELGSTKQQLATARDQYEACKQQAEQWAQEARTQRATVHECYRAVTGGKGEPADWHGAQPVVDALSDLRAQLDPEREHYIAETLRNHEDGCLGCCRCNLAAYERARKEAK